MNTAGQIITKTICIEKIIIPKANFDIMPNVFVADTYYACSNQTIYFINQSQSNEGAALYSYLWNFGDGESSSAFEPSHSYSENGIYTITLIVTNSCGCTSKISKEIKIDAGGFDIDCPSIACEGDISTYSLPFDGQAICFGNYNWTITGGHLASAPSDTIQVIWDAVDNLGFGYVTFNPSNCTLPCYNPTTIKIPVIKKRGTIVGNPSICLGSQGKFHLPQWPSTDFHWEVVGNVGNALALVFPTDQRNEVIVEPMLPGIIVLRAVYNNTLLHCGGTAEITIKVGNSTDITGPKKICSSAYASFSTTDYVDWEIKNHNGDVIFNQNGVTAINYQFHNTGIYYISANGAFCATSPKTIEVVASPQMPNVATIIGELLICPNTPYSYSLPNAPAGFQYRWDIINGTIAGNNIGNQVIVTYNNAATHQIQLLLESLDPICQSPVAIVNINNKVINATISQANATICANNSSSYQALETNTTLLHTQADTYTWSVVPASAGSITSGQGSNSINVLWSNTTTTTNASLQLVITKCTLAPLAISKPVTVFPSPIISITANNTVCSGTPITFALNTTIPLDAGTQVVWSDGTTNTTGGTAFTTILTNIGTTNITKIITAKILNPNGCTNPTNTASFTLTLLPQPPATNSILSGENAFCFALDINTVLEASTPSGCTLQWYHDNALLMGETNGTLHCAQYGFGVYKFLATNSAGCSIYSNLAPVVQFCMPQGDPPCVITPTPVLVNDAQNSGCNTFSLSGTATPAPNVASWSILGPGFSISGYTASTYTAPKVGVYQLFYKAEYNCPTAILTYNSQKTLAVPYLADFAYSLACNNNNNFTINLTDKSPFLSDVTNRVYKYYAGTSTSAMTLINTSTINGDYVFTDTSTASTIYIKLEIQGVYNGVTYAICTKTLTILKATLPPTTTITVTPPNCLEAIAEFVLPSNIFLQSFTYLWSFGDGTTLVSRRGIRTYSAPGTYPVSVTVTNTYGCSRTYTTTVVVPPSCFNGAMVATPSNATVCQGQNIALQYVPNNDNCTPEHYIWMNGNTPIAGTANTPTYTTNTPGTYWVKVIKGNPIISACYKTTNQISPLFNVPPAIELISNSPVCEGSEINILAHTTATPLVWFLDGVPQPNFNNLTNATFSAALGTHNIVVTATQNGCSSSASHTVEVLPKPAIPQITQTLISCNPYAIKLATTGSGGFFNWSNGQTGDTIIVSNGGPYSVTQHVGSCSSQAQIVVPKNPEEFLWVFPSGCITLCGKDYEELLGPIAHLNSWLWAQNGNVTDFGENFMPPNPVGSSASYGATINTGFCEATAPKFIVTVDKCNNCHLEYANININGTVSNCVYTATGTFTNSFGVAVTATLSCESNAVFINPTPFTINATGVTQIPLVLSYQNGFTGGALFFFIHITVDGVPCIQKFEVQLPNCVVDPGKHAVALPTLSTFVVVSNPAQNVFMLYYPKTERATTITLTDALGRTVWKDSVLQETTQKECDISQLPQGLYLITILSDNQPIFQTKLIKN